MKSLSQYEVDDPTFVDDLKNSQHHVHQVAQWLRGFKYVVHENPVRIRPDIQQMGEYSDDGDLEVEGVGRVEVKQRKIDFSSKENYPYSTVIVDVAHTWERAEPKPAGYIITNEQATACLVIKSETSEHWIEEKRWDRFKKRFRRFLECPVEHCLFYEM